jgi:hypothetical protein
MQATAIRSSRRGQHTASHLSAMVRPSQAFLFDVPCCQCFHGFVPLQHTGQVLCTQPELNAMCAPAGTLDIINTTHALW